jgi:hypothetical protein
MKKLFLVPILTLLFLSIITMAGAEWGKIQLTDNTKGENVGHIPAVLSLLLFSSEHTINGTVGGDVQAGVTITLSGDSSATTTTDTGGNYSFTGLSNGSYAVTPSLSVYSFTPTSQNIIVADADETGVDFTAVEIIYTYSVNGTVGGDVQAGVTITLSGDSSATTTTGTGGNYSFTGLLNGSYTVTPSLSDYSFTPTSEIVTISDADDTGVDFAATIINSCDTRFLDNSDGTVTDCLTGLIWLKNAGCFVNQNWATAGSSAAGLSSGECGLTDGSIAGDWRLPTKDELQGIGTNPPTTWLTAEPSVAWTIPGVPFVSVQLSDYWSNTLSPLNPFYSWSVRFLDGYTYAYDKSYTHIVWPVR